jgi:sialate O-acetylesterase
MAVAALIVSANRDKRPTPEETKKLAELSLEEGVPASGLRIGKGEPDLLTQIPEARTFAVVFDLDLAKLKRPAAYDIDNRATITRPFDRIAYLMELQKTGGPAQFVFVSMDAFTPDINKVGLPETSTGAKFQMKVASMNVHSNAEGIATGIGLDGGNIEFWPNNYGPYNSTGIPNATNDKYDFGDTAGDPVEGYGCMQVHNHQAKQTIFAINKWQSGNAAEIGIGNSPTGNPDYTFTNNGAAYSFKRLRVLVRQKP